MSSKADFVSSFHGEAGRFKVGDEVEIRGEPGQLIKVTSVEVQDEVGTKSYNLEGKSGMYAEHDLKKEGESDVSSAKQKVVRGIFGS